MTTLSIVPRTTHRTRRAAIFGAALAGAALLGLSACGRQSRAATTSPDGPTDEPQFVTVRTNEFRFSEATIRVPVGQRVRLVLDNAGLIEHDLRVAKLPARDVRVDSEGHGHAGEVAAHAAPGKQAWVEFTPTRKGTYDVECTITGHKEAGMKGKLVVD